MAIWQPFEFQGRAVMSFKGLDAVLGRTKGSAFRAFKHCGRELREGRDFLRLDAYADAQSIEALKAADRVYQTSVHVVLLTATGVARVFADDAS